MQAIKAADGQTFRFGKSDMKYLVELAKYCRTSPQKIVGELLRDAHSNMRFVEQEKRAKAEAAKIAASQPKTPAEDRCSNCGRLLVRRDGIAWHDSVSSPSKSEACDGDNRECTLEDVLLFNGISPKHGLFWTPSYAPDPKALARWTKKSVVIQRVTIARKVPKD